MTLSSPSLSSSCIFADVGDTAGDDYEEWRMIIGTRKSMRDEEDEDVDKEDREVCSILSTILTGAMPMT